MLELDFDEYRHKNVSARSYARIWGWSRTKTIALIAEFKAHNADNYASEYPQFWKATKRPAKEPQKSHLNRTKSNSYEDAKATKEPPKEPQKSHCLEPEPREPEGRGKSPSHSPTARGVGAADSRARQAEAQIDRALEDAPPEAVEKRDERRQRLEVLAEMFLGSSRVADAAQLRAYFRTTSEIPSALLTGACDAALASSERGFAPSPHAINQAGEKLAAQARKRARG